MQAIFATQTAIARYFYQFVNKLNELIAGTPFEMQSLEDIIKNSDLDVDKHQRYLHIFENLKQYGLDSTKIYYLNEKELESNSVNSCDPVLEILMSTR